MPIARRRPKAAAAGAGRPRRRSLWIATATGVWIGCAALTAGPAAAQSTCTQLSFTSIALGAYTGAASTSGATSGKLTCPSGSSFSLGLGKGAGSGATTTLRKLTSGSATLTYQLFQNSALTVNWGDIGTSGAESGVGTGSSQTFTAYPLVPAGQTPVPGTYTDTIIAALSDNGTSTGTISVSATVVASCTVSAAALAFGAYLGVQLDATSTLSITCTNSTPYSVGLSAGAATSATVATRRMQGKDSNGVQYALARDSARTLNWGVTVGTDTLAATGSGTVQTLTVYGRVAAGQRVAPAAYSDTIVATLTY